MYGGIKTLTVYGKVQVTVNGTDDLLIQEDGPSLTGCDWLHRVWIDWTAIFTKQISTSVHNRSPQGQNMQSLFSQYDGIVY